MDLGSSLRRASSYGLENKEIAWWACEHKLRYSLGVSTGVWLWTSYGLDWILRDLAKLFTCFVFGRNREGLTTWHIVCNQLDIYELRIVIWYQILYYFFLLLCFYCVVVSHCIRWYQSTVVPECVDRSPKLRQFAPGLGLEKWIDLDLMVNFLSGVLYLLVVRWKIVVLTCNFRGLTDGSMDVEMGI